MNNEKSSPAYQEKTESFFRFCGESYGICGFLQDLGKKRLAEWQDLWYTALV